MLWLAHIPQPVGPKISDKNMSYPAKVLRIGRYSNKWNKNKADTSVVS